jgi:hypothetical protein
MTAAILRGANRSLSHPTDLFDSGAGITEESGVLREESQR